MTFSHDCFSLSHKKKRSAARLWFGCRHSPSLFTYSSLFFNSFIISIMKFSGTNLWCSKSLQERENTRCEASCSASREIWCETLLSVRLVRYQSVWCRMKAMSFTTFRWQTLTRLRKGVLFHQSVVGGERISRADITHSILILSFHHDVFSAYLGGYGPWPFGYIDSSSKDCSDSFGETIGWRNGVGSLDAWTWCSLGTY